VDAIGTSPLAEMCCKPTFHVPSRVHCSLSVDLWNGIKKMAPEQLNKTLDILDWSRTSHPEKHTKNLDETATCSLLRASLIRSLGKFDEAHTILKTEILSHDK
jgi:hypothetical protein